MVQTCLQPRTGHSRALQSGGPDLSSAKTRVLLGIARQVVQTCPPKVRALLGVACRWSRPLLSQDHGTPGRRQTDGSDLSSAKNRALPGVAVRWSRPLLRCSWASPDRWSRPVLPKPGHSWALQAGGPDLSPAKGIQEIYANHRLFRVGPRGSA